MLAFRIYLLAFNKYQQRQLLTLLLFWSTFISRGSGEENFCGRYTLCRGNSSELTVKLAAETKFLYALNDFTPKTGSNFGIIKSVYDSIKVGECKLYVKPEELQFKFVIVLYSSHVNIGSRINRTNIIFLEAVCSNTPTHHRLQDLKLLPEVPLEREDTTPTEYQPITFRSRRLLQDEGGREDESGMATGAVVAAVIGVIVVLLIILGCCGFCVYKYFWKNKKNPKKKGDLEGGGVGAVPNGQAAATQNSKPVSNGKVRGAHKNNVNLEQINLAFDRAYDPQGSFDNDAQNSINSSLSSQNEWMAPNKSYSYDQSASDSVHTSDSEFERHHMSTSTEHSRKSIRWSENLPTLKGDQPPPDGRSKIGRAKVTLVPPPAPRGKMPLPIIEVNKSQLRRKNSSGGGGHPRVSMNPMPSAARVVRKHSTGSRSASLNAPRGTSPHRRSGKRSNSRSPHRNSGRRSRSSDNVLRRHEDLNDSVTRHNTMENRSSGSSFDSNLSVDVFTPAPDISENATNRSNADYSMGMHPGMTAPTDKKSKSQNKPENYTHIVAGNTGIVPVDNEQIFERNAQPRRSRSRKRRPRNANDSDTSVTRDIVSGNETPSGSVDSPPTLQMVAPGGKTKAQNTHASPLAQSSPQTQRKMQDSNIPYNPADPAQQSFESYSGEVRPRMPYDYFPPGSPGDALETVKGKNKHPHDARSTSYQPEAYKQETRNRSRGNARGGDQVSDLDSNYYSGSSNDPYTNTAPKARAPLVFEGVSNPGFDNDENLQNTPYNQIQPQDQQQNKPKKRRRKSQNRGKNTSGSTVNSVPVAQANTGVQNMQQNMQTNNGPYKPQAMPGFHEFSNDSLVYMDYGTDTDIYSISSAKAAKAKSLSLQGGKSGETEL